MNHLYFLRHCKTEYNDKKIISGSQDVHIYPKQEITNIDLIKSEKQLTIISSDLIRCKETLDLLLPLINSPQYIFYTDSLRERNMGILEGMFRREADNKYPELFNQQRFIYYKTPPHGEEFDKFKKRISMIYKFIIMLSERQNVLICSHNQVLKLLYFQILNLKIDENWFKKEFCLGEICKIL